MRAFQLSQLHFRLQMHRAKPEHSVGQVSARSKIAVTFDMQVLTLLFDHLCLDNIRDYIYVDIDQNFYPVVLYDYVFWLQNLR